MRVRIRPKNPCICWGDNTEGQLGGFQGEISVDPQPVDLEPTEDLCCGDLHCCAVTEESKEVWCWGANSRLQLGNNDATDPGPSRALLESSRRPDMGIC